MGQNIAILLSGIIAGCILFQSAINAPLLFKYLNIEQARPILRGIFPVLFVVNSVLGGAIVVIALLMSASKLALAAGAATLIGSVFCRLLVPATNLAADQNNQARFALLHRISVIVTMGLLLLNLGWPFF